MSELDYKEARRCALVAWGLLLGVEHAQQEAHALNPAEVAPLVLRRRRRDTASGINSGHYCISSRVNDRMERGEQPVKPVSLAAELCKQLSCCLFSERYVVRPQWR